MLFLLLYLIDLVEVEHSMNMIVQKFDGKGLFIVEKRLIQSDFDFGG